MSLMTSLTSSKRDNSDQHQRILPSSNNGIRYSTETYPNWTAVAYLNVDATTDAKRPSHFDVTEFLADKAQQNNQRKQKLASWIDEYSRLIIPVLYKIFITAYNNNNNKREFSCFMICTTRK
jgi:hypothetical protein